MKRSSRDHSNMVYANDAMMARQDVEMRSGGTMKGPSNF